MQSTLRSLEMHSQHVALKNLYLIGHPWATEVFLK